MENAERAEPVLDGEDWVTDLAGRQEFERCDVRALGLAVADGRPLQAEMVDARAIDKVKFPRCDPPKMEGLGRFPRNALAPSQTVFQCA